MKRRNGSKRASQRRREEGKHEKRDLHGNAGFPCVKQWFLKGRTSNLKFKNDRKLKTSCLKRRQASKTRQEGEQEGEKEAQKHKKNPKKGCHTSILLRGSCDPAATGVIFAVDVVPLSILAS